jgi:hypothetical protein
MHAMMQLQGVRLKREGMMDMAKGLGRQGFASMSVEKRKEISALGGKAAHQQGRAHRWTSEEARAAERKSLERRRAKGSGG